MLVIRVIVFEVQSNFGGMNDDAPIPALQRALSIMHVTASALSILTLRIGGTKGMLWSNLNTSRCRYSTGP